MSPRTSALPWLWLSALVFVFDQLTKLYFDGSLQMYQQIVIIPGYFSWTLAYNTGAAFSFLADAGGWQLWLFTGLAVALSGLLGWWLFNLPRSQWKAALPYVLVIGGAIGHLIDRQIHGYVVDFIQWHVAGYYWPAFNIADSAITVGAVLLVFSQFTAAHPKEDSA